MGNYPYSDAAFAIRRELEPSMLNGDAHHSLSGRLSYAFGRCWLNTRTPQRIAEAA